MSTTASSPAHEPKPLYLKLAKRMLIAIIVVVLGVVPAVILLAITKEPAVTWATGAFIAGAVAVMFGGVDVGIKTSLVMGLLAPVAIVAGSSPVAGAALLAVVCLMVGRTSRYGLQRATMLVPIFIGWMVISPPFWGPQETIDRLNSTYLLWMAATFFIGGIFAVIVVHFGLRKVHLPAPTPHPTREVVPYTVIITVLTTAATYWSLDHPKQYAGAWLISTIMVLTQVGDVGTVRKTIGRVVGTVLGMVVVWVIVVEIQSLTLVYVIGLVFCVAALTAKFSPHYWIYMALITPTIVCFSAFSSAQVANLGEQRLEDTIVGAVLVLIAMGLAIGYARLAGRFDRHVVASSVPI
ncbi:MAG: FUSC family protein [Actinobacteria bacterium]|nr:FUSC family protein [Actinomycetota bacterium]